MASKEELYSLAGRAVTNPTFRDEVLVDPVKAADSMKITLTDEQKKWLSDKHPQWESFLHVLKESKKVGVMSCGNCIVDGH